MLGLILVRGQVKAPVKHSGQETDSCPDHWILMASRPRNWGTCQVSSIPLCCRPWFRTWACFSQNMLTQRRTSLTWRPHPIIWFVVARVLPRVYLHTHSHWEPGLTTGQTHQLCIPLPVILTWRLDGLGTKVTPVVLTQCFKDSGALTFSWNLEWFAIRLFTLSEVHPFFFFFFLF